MDSSPKGSGFYLASLPMFPVITAVGIASGLYHAMLTGAAVVGILTACPADAEICSKARGMATHSGIAVVGSVALSAVAIRRGGLV